MAHRKKERTDEMWKFSSRLVGAAAAGCIVFAAGYFLGAKTAPGFGKNGPEAIAVGDTVGSEVKEWQWLERVKRHIQERQAIVAALRGIAEDESRDREERIFAILEMARTKSDEAVIFMLNNIDLWIRKNLFIDDDDESKQEACFYALKSMGWQIIPHAVEFTKGQRSQKQIELLARLFEQICGPRVARTLLEAKRGEFAGDPAKAQAVKNITQMLRHIRGVESGEK